MTWRDNPENNIANYSVQRSRRAGGPYKEIATPHKANTPIKTSSVEPPIAMWSPLLIKPPKESGLSKEVSARPDENGPTVEIFDSFEGYGWKGGKGWSGPGPKKEILEKLKRDLLKGQSMPDSEPKPVESDNKYYEYTIIRCEWGREEAANRYLTL